MSESRLHKSYLNAIHYGFKTLFLQHKVKYL